MAKCPFMDEKPIAYTNYVSQRQEIYQGHLKLCNKTEKWSL